MQHFLGAKLWKSRPKFAIDRLPEMPTDEPQRSAEAVRRALPSLLKLRRYEVRAVAERDRAVRALVAANNLNLAMPMLAKRTQFLFEKSMGLGILPSGATESYQPPGAAATPAPRFHG